MKRQTIAEIIAALLILLFVYTSLSKVFDHELFMMSLNTAPFIGPSKASIALWIIPSIELLASMLLFIPRTRLFGMYSSFLLMSIFTLYVGYIIAFVQNRPCSCGGVISSFTWIQHLFFNIFFTLLAFTGIILMKSKADSENRSSHNVIFT